MDSNSYKYNISSTFDRNIIYKGYSNTKKDGMPASDTLHSQDRSIKFEESRALNRNTVKDDEFWSDINPPINIILDESSQCFKTRIAIRSASQQIFSQTVLKSYISSTEGINQSK